MLRQVCGVEDLAVGAMQKFDVAGTSIVLYRLQDGFYATQRLCSHTWAPLDRGRLENDCVVCPLHRARFDVRTGAVKHWANFPPGIQLLNFLRGHKPLTTYPVELKEDRVWVDV